MNNIKFLPTLLMLVCCAPYIFADDDDQADIRENPNIEDTTTSIRIAREYPGYINREANHIDLNGDDWADLVKYLNMADSFPVNIVHIGDSHLQADMATSVVRNRLGSELGHLRGRGLVIPFKLAGTNQPYDYTITSNSEFTQSRLLKTPWPTAMSFTGIGIEPVNDTFDITLHTQEKFDALTVYFTGDSLQLIAANDSIDVTYTCCIEEEGLLIEFGEEHSNVTLDLNAPNGTTIHGITAELGCSGLAYHVIGNNGAQFSSYSGVSQMGKNVATLAPDLIIMSLGTNEAFGRFSKIEFRKQLDSFVSQIIRTNPGAKLLLTTPSECQRRNRRRSRSKYYVNSNIALVREVILEYAKDKHIPYYDWYEVSGGEGSSTKWVNDKNLNKDRIHMTRNGYQIQGELFADALLEVLKPTI